MSATGQLSIPGAETTAMPVRARSANGQFAKAASSAGRVIERQGYGQGVYTGTLGSYIPRVQDPQLYEDLREAIPMLDSALGALDTLDGFVEVESDSDEILRAWKEWSEGISVGDAGQGFQAAVDAMRGEKYEQGVGLMEFVVDPTARDVVRLNVADSKRIWFEASTPGAMDIYYQQTLRTRRNLGAPHEQMRKIIQPAWSPTQYIGFSKTDAVLLDRDSIAILRNRPENNSPWGVSALRSVPFIAKVMATILNSVLSVRERFGDPAYFLKYKAGKRRSEKELKEINASLAADIASVVAAKRRGRSADIVQSVGKDDDIEITVLGADNEVIDVRTDGDFIVGQIASAIPIPLCLIGVPTANNETAAISHALFAAKKRFAADRPILKRPIEAMLRMRGVKAPVGSWDLVQRQPDYEDVLKKAQANFMDAQRSAIYNASLPEDRFIEVSTPAVSGATTPPPAKRQKGAKAPRPAAPDVDGIASRFGAALSAGWDELLGEIAAYVVGGTPKGAKAPRPLDDETISYLIALGEKWAKKMVEMSQDQPPPASVAAEGAVTAGAVMASAHTGFAAPIMGEALKTTLIDAGLTVLQETLATASGDIIRQFIGPALPRFVETGANPQDLARVLHDEVSEVSSARWHKIARTEVAGFVETGKREEWQAEGVTHLTSVISNPACPSCGPTAGVHPVASAPKYPWDTHPNCVCTTRPATRSERQAAGSVDPPLIPNPNRDLLPEDLR
jgi:hypothetical protein